MRKLFFSLMLGMSFICGNFSFGSEIHRELRAVRKVYLDELGVPPSPSEIEWLCVYEEDTYKAAVDHVLDFKYGKDFIPYKEELKKYYLSSSYKYGKYELLPTWQIDLILKFQVGNVSLDKAAAKSLLIKNALSIDESNEDPIDYLFLCLCGRTTNINEMNYFNKVYKSYTCETKGLEKVLNDILLCHSYMFK